MNYKDYYKTLGITKSATQDEIKKAYRKLAVKYHPDKNPGSKSSEDKFKEINEAYEVIGNAENRKKYDQLGSNWKQYENSNFGNRGYDFSQFTGGKQRRGHNFGNKNENFGGNDFSEFFKTFFAGMDGFENFSQEGNLKGQDFKTSVELNLEEVLSGTTRIFDVDGRKIKLNIKPGIKDGQELRMKGAGGNGNIGGDLYVTVAVKQHNRFQRDNNDLILAPKIDLYTAILGGKIQIETLSGKLNINIPAGTQNDSLLRIKGKGLPEYGKEQIYGDLILKISIQIPENLSNEEITLFKKLKDLSKVSV